MVYHPGPPFRTKVLSLPAAGRAVSLTHSMLLPWEFPLTEGVVFAQVNCPSLGASLHQGLVDARVQRLSFQSEKGPSSFRAPLGGQLRADTTVWKSIFSFGPALPLPSLLYRSHSCLCSPISLLGVNSISELIAGEPTYKEKFMSWALPTPNEELKGSPSPSSRWERRSFRESQRA